MISKAIAKYSPPESPTRSANSAAATLDVLQVLLWPAA
jgi:hypothetical protein